MNRDALIFYAVDYEPDIYSGGTDYSNTQKDTIRYSIQAFNDHLSGGGPWDVDEAKESTLDGSPEFDLESLMTGVSGRGLVMIDTHGIDGIIAVESFNTVTARDNQFDYYTDPPDSGGLGWSVSWFEPVSTLVSGTTAFHIALTPDGIANLLQYRDSDSFTFITGCQSLQAASSWIPNGNGYFPPGAFIGASESFQPGEAAWVVNVFRRLACEPGPDGTIDRRLQHAFVATLPTTGGWQLLGNNEWELVNEVGCDDIEATFHGAGANGGVVWAAVSHLRSREFALMGFRREEDWPDHYEVVREFEMNGENDYRIYEEVGLPLDQFALFAFREKNRAGRETWSKPIVPQPGLPPLDEFKQSPEPSRPHAELDRGREVWFSKDGAVLFSPPHSAGVLGVAGDGANGRADVAVYSSDSGLLIAEWSELIQRGWSARACLGNGTWQDALVWAQEVYDDNQTWCDQNPGQCNESTALQVPALAIVGDPNYINDSGQRVSYFTEGRFPNENDICGIYTLCPSLSMAADFMGDAIEDIPVYLVPAESVQDVYNLSSTARRYEGTWGANPSNRAIFLYGDVRGNDEYPNPERALGPLMATFFGNGIPTISLSESEFVSPMSKFIQEVNVGATFVLGFGLTTERKWPGGFLKELTEPFDWENSLTTPQSLIVLIPSCHTAAEQFAVGTWFESTHIKKGIIADPAGTSIAFAVGQMAAGWDTHYELWAEMLALTYADSEVGRPWPHIIWEAKRRAADQHPFIVDHLRSTASLGTMVRKQEQTEAVGVEVSGRRSEGTLAAFAFRNPSRQPGIRFALRNRQDIAVVVYDLAGRKLTDLYLGPKEAGDHKFTWNGRTRSGSLAPAGVYFIHVSTQEGQSAVVKVVVLR